MYSKTRNTLTALIAASLFVAAGWTFGHPIPVASPSQPSPAFRMSLADSGTHDTVGINGSSASVSSGRRSNHMNLAMPYFSFSMQLAQRRAD